MAATTTSPSLSASRNSVCGSKHSFGGPEATPHEPNRITNGDLVIDEDAHQVFVDGVTPVQLSPTEYRLLRYLMLNRDRVLSKDQILDYVWEYDFGGNAGIVETYVGYLRKKLGPGVATRIETVRGFGYVLRTKPTG